MKTQRGTWKGEKEGGGGGRRAHLRRRRELEGVSHHFNQPPPFTFTSSTPTQKGAALIYEELRRRGLKVVVAGIPKTIDNDIPIIDKSFGFDTAVEEAQRAISAAHVEAESAENGIGLVKLMGRHSGFIAMYASLASREVDCCLIPESPFYLEGPGGLFEFVEKRHKYRGHMVLIVFINRNKCAHFAKEKKMTINLKYIG
ncbi:hypothetical protein Droror1_Dr00020315 [Drosera rotundifolia]